MLSELQSTLAGLCSAAGLLVTIAGALLIIWGLLANGGPGAWIRGGILIVIGMWFSRLAG